MAPPVPATQAQSPPPDTTRVAPVPCAAKDPFRVGTQPQFGASSVPSRESLLEAIADRVPAIKLGHFDEIAAEVCPATPAELGRAVAGFAPGRHRCPPGLTLARYVILVEAGHNAKLHQAWLYSPRTGCGPAPGCSTPARSWPATALWPATPVRRREEAPDLRADRRAAAAPHRPPGRAPAAVGSRSRRPAQAPHALTALATADPRWTALAGAHDARSVPRGQPCIPPGAIPAQVAAVQPATDPHRLVGAEAPAAQLRTVPATAASRRARSAAWAATARYAASPTPGPHPPPSEGAGEPFRA
jgi:hypothetical protein